MNKNELKEFLAALKGTDVEELTLESGDTKVHFKRNDVVPAAASPVPAAPQAAAPEKKLIPVRSPMVGTFYHSASSDHPPFVIEGNHVVPGQKVGIIEAMKLNKDVTSTANGKIVKVSVKNGQPVEYGQELFLIDADDAAAEDR